MPDPAEKVNVAMVSGTIIEEPMRDTNRAGYPVTVFLIAIKAPDDGANDYSSCLEVEAPDSIADRQRRQLRPGRRVALVGQLMGAGGLWATTIVTQSQKDQVQTGEAG